MGAHTWAHRADRELRATGERGWRPGTIVNSAVSEFEIETQQVIDRLLRECFDKKSARRTG